MGVCFSKSGKASPSSNVHSKAPPKDNDMVNEEKKQPKLAENMLELTVNKDYCKDEENTWEKETNVKNTAKHEDESRTDPGTAAQPLRVSSCTKEELDAILIQCGRLSRNSSCKASKELARSSERKRRSGSKGSRDFDDERKEEGNELDKSESRPSPSRRASSRERSGSRERGTSGGRRVSRSPGRRLDGSASSAISCDKLKQQPTKMVSVPATEKCSLFSNDRAESAGLGAEIISAAHQLSRSNSPVKRTGISNENAQSATKTVKFPYRREPMAEIEDNSLRNRNEINTSMFNQSKEVDEGTEKPIHTQIIQDFQQAKKPEMVEEAMDAKANVVENLSKRTINRIRSRPSIKSSQDLDHNQELNQISNTTLKFEEIQKKKHQHQDVFLFPTDVSETYSILQSATKCNSSFTGSTQIVETSSILQAVTELIPSFSELRSYGTKIVTEPELEVKGSSTVRDVEPQESTGSNTIRVSWASPSDMNCVDSSDYCCSQLSVNGKEVVVKDGAMLLETQQQKRSWSETALIRGQKLPPAVSV